MSPQRAFVEFEEKPLRLVLDAFARAEGCEIAELRPSQRSSAPRALELALAELGLRVDMTRLRTLRALVGAVVPLLETRPRAHH